MQLLKTVLFLAGVMLHLVARAQPESDNYERITTRDGLPHNVVLNIMQDSYGYLWIGTYNGLCIYDGKQFKVRRDVFGSFQSNNWTQAIESIYEAKNKKIWLGSWGGLVSFFDYYTQSFRTFKKALPSKVTSFYEDADGRMWAGMMDGSISYTRGDSFEVIRTNLPPVIKLFAIRGDSIGILTRTGIFAYSKGKVFSYLSMAAKEGTDWTGTLTAGNKLFICSNVQLGIVNLDTKQLEHSYVLPNEYNGILKHLVINRCEDNIVATNANVIYEYDTALNVKTTFHISDNAWYNGNAFINSIFKDANGIIWIGSQEGLLKVDSRKYIFKKYTTNNLHRKLTGNYIRSINTSLEGNVLVGLRGGAVNFLKYNKEEKNYSVVRTFGLKEHIRKDLLYRYITNTLLYLPSGKILAGGEGGVYEADIRDTVLAHLFNYHDSLISVWDLHDDKHGRLWIASNVGGLYIYNASVRKMHHYRPGGNNPVWNIYEDKKGRIWLATNKGLYRVHNTGDITKLVFTHYRLKGDEEVRVWSFTEDADSNLWIGTTGHGLFMLDAERKYFTSYNDMPSKVISALVTDRDQDLWISTVNGLYQKPYKAHRFIRYDEEDGLISNDYNFNAAAIAPDGELFFGTKTGMVSFYPRDVKQPEVQNAPVRITSVRVMGKDSTAVIYNNRPMILPHNHNFLSLGFAVLNFQKTRSHKYRYKLDGFDKYWQYTDANNPSVNYTNIPPGNYTFLLYGSADGNTWSIQNAVLHIKIIPAFWQRTWFVVLCVAGILLLIIYIAYRRATLIIRQERKQNAIEKKMAELELRALQAQMNPHFIFNTINSIQYFILNSNEREANEHLSMFARLMRLFLESSKNRYILLKAELELLNLYLSLEKLRFENKFDYIIDIDETIDTAGESIPSMLIQPFVENAVNHGLVHKGSKGLLHIEFRKAINPGRIICVIDDNGIGRSKAAEIRQKERKHHISRGMELINERVKTYNFIDGEHISIKIIDKEPPEEGTSVAIIITGINPKPSNKTKEYDTHNNY